MLKNNYLYLQNILSEHLYKFEMDLMNIMSTQKHLKMNVTNVFVVFFFETFLNILYSFYIHNNIL